MSTARPRSPGPAEIFLARRPQQLADALPT
jgi:hypothetical protein